MQRRQSIGRRARPWIAAPAVAGLAFASALVARPGEEGVGRTDRRPYAPRAAAQPAPSATALPPSVADMAYGDRMPCGVDLRLAPAPEAVALGTRFTVGAAARVDCPNAFDHAAALLFVGNAAADTWPSVLAAADVVATAAGEAGVPLAVVDAAAEVGAIRWHAGPAGRAAALATLAARPPGAEVDGERWTAALRAARDALEALPLDERPLLFAVDGRRPRFSVLAQAELETVAHLVHDAGGRTAVVDASPEGWLAASTRLLEGAGIVGFDASAMPLPAVAAGGARLLANRLRGVVDQATLDVHWNTNQVFVVPGSAAPPPVFDGHGIVQWLGASATGGFRLEGTVALDAIATGRGLLVAQLRAQRDAVEAGEAFASQVLCVHPTGGTAADCVPTPAPTRAPPPTATPGPSATATTVPTATTTRTPRPTATPWRRPTRAAVGRVWLPLAGRGSVDEAAAGAGLRRHGVVGLTVKTAVTGDPAAVGRRPWSVP